MKINLKKLSIVFLLTITGCNVNNSSNKEEIDNFTLLADENKKTLDDGKAYFFLTIDSNSNLKNHKLLELIKIQKSTFYLSINRDFLENMWYNFVKLVK